MAAIMKEVYCPNVDLNKSNAIMKSFCSYHGYKALLYNVSLLKGLYNVSKRGGGEVKTRRGEHLVNS